MKGNTGNSCDFRSKSDSQRFRNPLISSTCRSNSLSRLTGNFLQRIRNKKRDNGEPKTAEQRKLEGGRMTACCGNSYRFPSRDIQIPFRARESLIGGPVPTAPIRLHPIPHHPARSNHPSCADRQFNSIVALPRKPASVGGAKRFANAQALAVRGAPTLSSRPCARSQKRFVLS